MYRATVMLQCLLRFGILSCHLIYLLWLTRGDFRLCALLEHWIALYPHDFYAKGVSRVLDSMLKNIALCDLLHYVAALKPFADKVKAAADSGDDSLDIDRGWAMRDKTTEDSDTDTDGEGSEGHDTTIEHAEKPLARMGGISGSAQRPESTSDSSLRTVVSTSPLLAPRKLSTATTIASFGSTSGSYSPPHLSKEDMEDHWWPTKGMAGSRRPRSSACKSLTCQTRESLYFNI